MLVPALSLSLRAQATQLTTNSSAELTAGPDWAITRSSTPKESSLHYKDFKEAERLAAIVEGDGQDGRILKDLAKSRFICTQPRFALEVRTPVFLKSHVCSRLKCAHVPSHRSAPHPSPQLCKRSVRAHQVKQCTPAYVEQLKCEIKL